MHFGVLFSVYPDSANWHTPLGRFFLRVQKWAFWPLSAFYWVTLRYDGIRDLFQRPNETKVDRFLMPLHWIVLLVIPGLIFGWPAALLAYVTVSCISSLMTASVFIPNHIGMRRLETGAEGQLPRAADHHEPQHREPAAARLLLRRPQLADRAPPVPARLPQPLPRRCAPIVRDFCEERGIAYNEVSLYRALASVGNHLGAMTAAARRAGQSAARVDPVGGAVLDGASTGST